MESNDVQPGSFLAPSLQGRALDKLGISPGEKKILHQMLKMGENDNKRELREQMTTHMDAKANDDIQLHCQYLVRQTVPFIHWVWVSNESK